MNEVNANLAADRLGKRMSYLMDEIDAQNINFLEFQLTQKQKGNELPQEMPKVAE